MKPRLKLAFAVEIHRKDALIVQAVEEDLPAMAVPLDSLLDLVEVLARNSKQTMRQI